MTIAVLAESQEDAEMVRVLFRRLLERESLRVAIKTKGFDGCGQLLSRGAKFIRIFLKEGCTKFIICHDADCGDASENQERVRKQVVDRSGCSDCCIVVPVHEIEAWVLADVGAVSRVITSWRTNEIPNPEAVSDPKMKLRQLQKQAPGRPLYIPAVHNQKVAEHLDLDKLSARCASFRTLQNFAKVHASAVAK